MTERWGGGWEGTLITYSLVGKCKRGSGCWMKATVHMGKQFDSGSSVKVKRLIGADLALNDSRESYFAYNPIGFGSYRYS